MATFNLLLPCSPCLPAFLFVTLLPVLYCLPKMLPAKSWKPEAILRFFMSVVVCFFAGQFLIAALQFGRGPSLPESLRFYGLLTGSLVCLCAALFMLRRSWEFESSLFRVSIILFSFYFGLTLGALAWRIAGTLRPSVPQMIVSALSLQGAGLILTTPLLRAHDLTWSDAFGFRNHPRQAILAGIAIGAAVVPTAWLLQAVSDHLMTWLNLNPQKQQVVQTLQMQNASAARAIFGFVSIVLVPPAEETFFRGLVYGGLRNAGYPRTALWVSSLFFAGVHMNMVSFIPLTVFALAVALLYEKTNNLLAPICAHALFNGANLLQLYLLERALTR